MIPLLLLSAWGLCPPLLFVQMNPRQDLSKNITAAAPVVFGPSASLVRALALLLRLLHCPDPCPHPTQGRSGSQFYPGVRLYLVTPRPFVYNCGRCPVLPGVLTDDCSV